MYHFITPGEEERKAILLPLVEAEVSEKEFNDAFSVYCEEPTLIKRIAEGQIAIDIRRRMGADENAQVFLTEMGGIAQIGDETWENFAVLTIECEGQEVEFDSGSDNNNFVAFLKWVDER